MAVSRPTLPRRNARAQFPEAVERLPFSLRSFGLLRPQVISRQTRMISLTVNGVRRKFDGDPATPLLWFLRDDLELTGTKYGCGVGSCGACTVHVEGRAVRACQTKMSELQDRGVTTIEGLHAKGEHPLQVAWRDIDVPQCGYCQSGQLMKAAELLKNTPRPTDQQIDNAMNGNICRCGTYPRIRAAIKAAAEKQS